ncbi:MAG: Flp pilus assembly complex ATPase component TadA [Desulfobacterales bacterium]|nr:Flp pilus assembly complex ATPase component TadA [Desulfobacterales bacterium]
MASLVATGRVSREQLAYAQRVQAKLETPRPTLEVLKDLKFVTDEQIKAAVRENAAPACLGSLLAELGRIRAEDLSTALAIRAESDPPRRMGEILLERRLIDERALLEVLSQQMGFPCVDPDFTEIDPRLFFKAPAATYEAHGFVPVRMEEGKPLIAFADPLEPADLDAARETFGPNLTAAIARKSAIVRAIKRAQRTKQRERISAADEGSIIALVDGIIQAAVARRASDIHIEPFKEHTRIRFRQDGVLVHHDEFPAALHGAVTNRLKVMCDVDITEKRRHQGGRFVVDQGERRLDLRASFYVTVHGEKIVLRLLNRQSQLIRLEESGMAPRMVERFKEEALYLPSGIILITGPTGSGKTTTVYGCINHINDPQTAIITAEEPVEYVIEGIAQCSINPRIQLTFEETLRHIVRQDPDVIVIGEIRDTFSAEVAVQAALTGHKVITTFHTEDSIGGLLRLLNMNIEAFLIASTVVSIMAQRLLRQVCPDCAASYRPTPIDLQRLGYGPGDAEEARFTKGRGCARCQYTGYRGRVGIFELLLLSEEIRNAIIQHQTSQEIRRISIESSGLTTLLEDGLVKAAAGVTTIEELLRCLPRLQRPRPLPELRRLLEV